MTDYSSPWTILPANRYGMGGATGAGGGAVRPSAPEAATNAAKRARRELRRAPGAPAARDGCNCVLVGEPQRFPGLRLGSPALDGSAAPRTGRCRSDSRRRRAPACRETPPPARLFSPEDSLVRQPVTWFVRYALCPILFNRYICQAQAPAATWRPVRPVRICNLFEIREECCAPESGKRREIERPALRCSSCWSSSRSSGCWWATWRRATSARSESPKSLPPGRRSKPWERRSTSTGSTPAAIPPPSSGSNALLERPQNEPKWNGPYLKKDVPLDPWGKPYLYTAPGERGEYDLVSLGKDGQPGGTGGKCGHHESLEHWRCIRVHRNDSRLAIRPCASS